METIKLEHKLSFGDIPQTLQSFPDKSNRVDNTGGFRLSEFRDGSKEVVSKGQHGRKENL